jgi:transcriptional regulator with XRE-family HTH domain
MRASRPGGHLVAEVGRALRTLRQQRRMTQRDVAEAAGVSSALLSSWETGKHGLHLESLDKVMAVLGVDLADVGMEVRKALLESWEADQVASDPEGFGQWLRSLHMFTQMLLERAELTAGENDLGEKR